MEMWKGNRNTNSLFSLKDFEILHQERGGQTSPNIILFHKSGPNNKQQTYQSIDLSISKTYSLLESLGVDGRTILEKNIKN